MPRRWRLHQSRPAIIGGRIGQDAHKEIPGLLINAYEMSYLPGKSRAKVLIDERCFVSGWENGLW